MFDFLKTDAIVIVSESNRFYFTGYPSTFGYVVLTKEDGVFFTDARYSEEAAARSKLPVVTVTNENVFYKIMDYLRDRAVRTLALEEDIAHWQYLILADRLKDFSIQPVGDVLKNRRAIKNDEEIQKIKYAQKITDKAFSKIIHAIKSGMTEYELAAILEYNIKVEGADLAFPSIVAFGENTSKPHAHPSERKLKKNEPILMDFGAKYAGYCSDMTRTVYFGKPDPEFKRTYNILLMAQKEAIAKIHAGLTAAEADSFAREILIAENMGDQFVHSLGHGVGVDIHEQPNVSMHNAMSLQENMVVTVEPGVYFPGKYGIRIEDLIVIGEKKSIDLTKSNKNLILI